MISSMTLWFPEIIMWGKPKFIITEPTPQTILSLLQPIVLGIQKRQLTKKQKLNKQRIIERDKVQTKVASLLEEI